MTFPFTAVLGADPMRTALILNAVSPQIGGVLVRGEKGTAKSTAVRGLAELLPTLRSAAGCRFGCDPQAPEPACPDGPHPAGDGLEHRPRLVELPVGASEDRVIGSLDLERALGEGVTAFQPGLLAAAHRGVLYVDEVNLLADHLVDVLLDAAAMGRNHVERDGVSVSHPARFLLIGSMNPEEGELRPQLLDRFGLAVDVAASRDPKIRVEVVRRRLAADADPDAFARRWAPQQHDLAARIAAARDRLPHVRLGDGALVRIAEVCAAFDVDGMRADIVMARTALAHAAWNDRDEVTTDDVRAAALLALPHRRRRNPFDEPGLDEKQLDDVLDRPDDDPEPDPGPAGGPPPAGPDDGPGDGQGDGAGVDTGRPETTTPDAGPSDAGTRDGATPDSAPADPEPAGAEASDARPSGTGGPTPPTASDGPAAQRSAPVGAAGRVRRLTGSGRAAATPGRRAQARTGAGRTTGVLPAGEPAGPPHLPATLAAAAPHQAARGRGSGPVRFRVQDVRRAERRGREGNLVLFVVDASGSMGARSRMSEVKGAVLGLLLDAYQRRDKVGLITFRDAGAEVVLPPTSSVDFAARRLAAIPTGGRTPLAAGLVTAGRVIDGERLRDPLRRPLVLLMTDGRADNSTAVRAGAALRGHDLVVVDCERGPVRLGLARRLAADLRADYLPLGEFTTEGEAA
ncbi:VWA domain-containing protein [Streptomyces sp. SL13]|uniref:Mg-protoporphyrin IX chelatase n=1 Tax=Streptantibioticus silvisoli TaxID=2705255 RepID=A0AA90H2F9_9ACTN|nr:VWA domain-containing protein [Streptantibioticus silvisoli]MDI5970821.1 VWA domain-containing protein [Streptantibioticus silvisoli]